MGEDRLEPRGGLLDFAHPRERLDRPEAADGEGRLAARNAVGPRRVAVEEAVGAQLAVEMGESAPEARRARVGIAVDAEEEEAGVRPLLVEDVHIALQPVAPA